MPRPPRTFRPPWATGDLHPRWPSVVACVLVPLGAGFAGLLGGYGAEIVAAVALWVFGRSVLRAVPTLTVDDVAIRLSAWGRTAEGGELHAPTVADLVTLDVAQTHTVLQAGRFGSAELDTSPFVAVPAALPADPAQGRPSALVVEWGAGRSHTRSLLPVWDPADARPLVHAIAAASPRLDAEVATADLPPEAEPPPTWRSVAAGMRTGPALAVLVPLAGIAVVWALSLVVRAVTLDPVLGSHVGVVVVAGFRMVELSAVVIGAATALVAVTALLAWARQGEPISVVDALRLGALRSLWAWWQLRVWIVGTGALMAATGVTGRRIALAYGAVTLAVPGIQLVRELLRRTVEESRGHPPPMERIARAHQWVTVAAAIVAYLLFRVL